jgi:hypothetical protein
VLPRDDARNRSACDRDQLGRRVHALRVDLPA